MGCSARWFLEVKQYHVCDVLTVIISFCNAVLTGKLTFYSITTYQVIGEVTSPTYYSRFLTIKRQLFVADVNELDSSLPNPPEIFEGKVSGEHIWPFSFRLPLGVRVSTTDEEKHNFRLPPTLQNQASKALIRYQLVVRVKKGLLSPPNRFDNRTNAALLVTLMP